MKAVSPTKKTQRTTSGNRVRAARSDASIVKMQATIEAAFGLPEGSVKLVGPRKNVRLDDAATVGDLRALWQPK